MTGRLLLCQEPLLHKGHAAVDQQQLGRSWVPGEAVQTQMSLAFKEAQVLSPRSSFKPVHCIDLSLNCLCAQAPFAYSVMGEGRHGVKTKSPHPKRDEGCLCIKLRGYHPKLPGDNVSLPSAFGALTLRSVGLFAGSLGWREMIPTGAPYSRQALSGQWCVHF